jgi:hypothetical protein
VMSMRVSLPSAGYREAAGIRSFYRNLHDRLRALPGVRSASISSDFRSNPMANGGPLHPIARATPVVSRPALR